VGIGFYSHIPEGFFDGRRRFAQVFGNLFDRQAKRDLLAHLQLLPVKRGSFDPMKNRVKEVFYISG
jgi:hypothetical protein